MAEGQRAFWSKVADRYDQVVDPQIGPKTRSMVRERLAREGGLGRLVEFGCGTGFYTATLATNAERVVATDLAPGMLALAKDRVHAGNVTFQTEDCQRTSLPDAAFDTAFLSLVIHFTEAEKTLAEMRRILKPGGTLIISNLDPGALGGLDRIRCFFRVLYQGLAGYRVKPPAGFWKHVVTGKRLCDLLRTSGFAIVANEMIQDPSRSSNIPLDFIKAVRMGA